MPPTDAAPPSETVSQSDIESLLAQVGGEESPAWSPETPANQAAPENSFLQRHEFPKLSLFSAAELRKLRVRHEEFINSLAARLSIRFGMEVSMQMSKLETTPFETFVDGLANPTHLTMLKLEPLTGYCLLDIPLRLSLCLVDRELGGTGTWKDDPRELTNMEVGLISPVVENILSEWCGVWRDLLDIRPVLAGCENNGRFLQTCAAGTTMLLLGMQLQIGSVAEEMQLALPYPTLEPLMLKLNAAIEATQKPALSRAAKPVKWNDIFDDMEFRLTAELPEVEVTAGQLANLKPGDVIPLQMEMLNRAELCLEGTPKFVAVLGMDSERWAVKIVAAK